MRTKDRPHHLTQQARVRISLAATRLAREWAEVFKHNEHYTRSVRTLSQHIGVDRSICHQLMQAVAIASDGLAAAAKFPGEAGLQQLIRALAKRGWARKSLAVVELASVDFVRAVKEEAGSRASLIRLLSLSADYPEHSEESQARHLLFRGASDLIGRWSHNHYSMSMVCPSSDSPGLVDAAACNALIGHWAKPNAQPFVRSYGVVGRRDDALMSTALTEDIGDFQIGVQPSGLVREFSSDGVPVSFTRSAGRSRIDRLLTIERPLSTQQQPFDIVTASAIRHAPDPMKEEWPVYASSTRIAAPAELLCLETYVHKSIARACMPSVGVFRSNVAGDPEGDQQWYEQLPVPLTLEMLGPGVRPVHPPLWSRQSELVLWMFERLGWNPNDFVAYRCAHTYPIWQCYYEMRFEFSRVVE